MPALASVLNSDSKWPRRASTSGFVVDHPVAVEAEALGRRERLPVLFLQVAQRDDVARALLEVDAPGRMSSVTSFASAAVESISAQIEVALTRARVQHDDRLAPREGLADIGDRDRARRVEGLLGVEPWHLRHDQRARAEAVVAVVSAAVDRLAGAVAGIDALLRLSRRPVSVVGSAT